MSALIGALRVSLSADTAQFAAGMKRAQTQAATSSGIIQKSLGGIKAGVAGLAAGLSIGLFANVIKGALDFAGSLGETAQQLGVTARELQVFRYAAGQSGVSVEQMDMALGKLSLNMSKAASGSATTLKAFKSVGVELADIQTKSRTDIFGQIADQMLKQGGAAKNSAAGLAIFGRGVGALTPLLDQGSAGLNQLSEAADKLGIVLSDEQIRNADETADKLEALKTVLSARIAGVVADNAQSILGFADSLVYLVGKVGDALAALAALRNWLNITTDLYSIPAQIKRSAGIPTKVTGLNRAGNEVTVGLGPVKPLKASNRMSGAPPQFLKSGGGGGSRKGGGAGRADTTAQDALRDDYQFAQQQSRAEMDILRAKQDLATNYIDRTSLAVQMLDLERDDYYAELAYQVALNGLTKGKDGLSRVQAEQLKLAYDTKDGLEREKVLQDEQVARQEDVAALVQGDFDRRRDALESMVSIATTAAERREIELELLKLAYEQRRRALQDIIDKDADSEEAENARRNLGALNSTYGNARQGVMNATRNPLEEWAASVPQTAAQITEALQGIQANALDGLTDSLMSIIDGTQSLQDAFSDMARSIIADIIRMTIRMLIFKVISGMFGGGFGGGTTAGGNILNSGIYDGVPAFATGGAFTVMGNRGPDNNVLSLNGLPIARVSHGERIGVDATSGANSGGPIEVRVLVEASNDLMVKAAVVADSRIRAATPQIVRSAANATMRAAGRPKLMGR